VVTWNWFIGLSFIVWIKCTCLSSIGWKRQGVPSTKPCIWTCFHPVWFGRCQGPLPRGFTPASPQQLKGDPHFYPIFTHLWAETYTWHTYSFPEQDSSLLANGAWQMISWLKSWWPISSLSLNEENKRLTRICILSLSSLVINKRTSWCNQSSESSDDTM
jgi:hypothetical protein